MLRQSPSIGEFGLADNAAASLELGEPVQVVEQLWDAEAQDWLTTGEIFRGIAACTPDGPHVSPYLVHVLPDEAPKFTPERQQGLRKKGFMVLEASAHTRVVDCQPQKVQLAGLGAVVLRRAVEPYSVSGE